MASGHGIGAFVEAVINYVSRLPTKQRLFLLANSVRLLSPGELLPNVG